MKRISTYEYKADEGKVFVHKETKQNFGNGIYLGVIDTIDNYNEEDAPEEDIIEPSPEQEIDQYDNNK